MSGETDFWDAVDGLRADGSGYAREAYGFVVAALSATVQALPAERRADPLRRHLDGRELLLGVIALAQREFGSLAPMVFSEWGVLEEGDVGKIVFQLVGCSQLSTRPEDRLEDFHAGLDLMRELAAAPPASPRDPGGTRPTSTA